MLKWAGALAASAVAGIAVGVGADRLLTPVKEVEKTVTETATQTRTVTSTATTTITQPAQTITQTSTATVTVTQTPPPPPSLKPPLSPEIKQRVEAIKNTLTAKHQGETFSYGSCTINCGGRSCLLKARIKNGVITAIEGDDLLHPNIAVEDEVVDDYKLINAMVQKRPCVRGRALRHWIYNPDRIKYPLKRVDGTKRGEGKFVRISWDEALTLVAKMITEVKEKYGSYSIWQRGASRFFSFIDHTVDSWGVCSFEAEIFAENHMLGITYGKGHQTTDMINSNLIVLWGHDPASTIFGTNTPYLMKLIKERKGTPIIAIDPRYSHTIDILVDQWIPIRPGTDIAFALAVAYILFTEDLYDKEYVQKFVEPTGVKKWKDYVLGIEDSIPKTPEWAEKICGVPAETIRAFARLYAKSKPVCLFKSWAPARNQYGENVARAAIALQALTGNIGIHGGYINTTNWAIESDRAPSPPSPSWGGSGKFKTVIAFKQFKWADVILLREEVGKSITSAQYNSIIGNPAANPLPNIKMIFNAIGQYLNRNMNILKGLKALEKVDYVVNFAIHMTPTALYSDVILPVAETPFEITTVDAPWGNISGCWWVYSPKCVEPQGEAKEPEWILTKLAEKMGFLKEYNPNYIDDSKWEEVKDKLLEASYEAKAKTLANMGRTLPSWKEFKKNIVYHFDFPEPLYSYGPQIKEGKPFDTKSGKIEIYSDYLEKTDLTTTKYGAPIPPIPRYIPPEHMMFSPHAGKYPLTMLTSHSPYRSHTAYDTNPLLDEETYRHSIWISVSDAKARGIKDGDLVRVYNDCGELIMPAFVTSLIMPGVVIVWHGAWFTPNQAGRDSRGACNVLTYDSMSPSGSFPVTSVVEVEKLR
jgi:anaerobic dimethyl sulfoxide reductase subunit A